MPAKRRPRNPLKPAITGPHAPSFGKSVGKFTGQGLEYITGEGDGILQFKDGACIGGFMARMTRKWEPEDAARRLRILGDLGLPADSQNPGHVLSIPDLAMFASKMIEAAHSGDAEAFRRVADAVNNPHPETVIDPESDLSVVFDAVIEAARKAGGIPTREQVRDILERLPAPDGFGFRFPNVIEADKLKILLEKIGFQWLPGRKQGEHLRRQSP